MTGDTVRRVMWRRSAAARSYTTHSARQRGLLLLDRLGCRDIRHSRAGFYAAANSYLDAGAGAPATGLPHHEPRLGIAGARISPQTPSSSAKS